MTDEPTPSESDRESAAAPSADVGPDPVWGVALGVFGLVNMAIAGALTRHYWFNVGEALMLLGALVFLGSVAVTNAKQGRLPTLSELRRRLADALRRN